MGVFSASLRHAIYQQRFSTHVVQQIIKLLNRSDRDLADQLRIRLARLTDRGPLTTRRLEEVLTEIRALNARAYQAVERQLSATLKDFAGYEVQFQAGMVSRYLPAGANFTAPPASLVAEAATAEPLRGKLLREWVEELSEAKYIRVRDAIRLGVVEGQTTDDIVRRIVGTRAANYSDGLMDIDRRGAQALVRTAVNDVATKARDAVYEENDDIIESVEWVATLDDRTCPTCAPLDGEKFALGEGPRPPRHVNCRCTTVPVFKAEFDLLSKDDLTRTSKGDEGPEKVRATLTYDRWLRNQSAGFQDDALGATRGALFRRGDLSVDRFVNRNGDQLTLDELRAREPKAFEEAGL
jgi:SPP1 gp7 family putative phage head morphogenesis protein